MFTEVGRWSSRARASFAVMKRQSGSVRDRNRDRGARYQIGKRSKAHAKFISRGVGRRFEERRKTGHEGQGIVEYMSEGE